MGISDKTDEMKEIRHVITSKQASNNRCLYFDSTGEPVPPYERCVCRSEGARSRTERAG
jgi:hypothetical protein